jgi:hypothetical protein
LFGWKLPLGISSEDVLAAKQQSFILNKYHVNPVWNYASDYPIQNFNKCSYDYPNMTSLSKLKIGKYRHSKTGNFYRVLGVAKHSETLEDLVIYECLYDNSKSKIWVRPLKMFLEEVEIEGRKVPRFVFIGN